MENKTVEMVVKDLLLADNQKKKKTLPDLTYGLITRPDPNPLVQVGSGKPAGTGVPADV